MRGSATCLAVLIACGDGGGEPPAPDAEPEPVTGCATQLADDAPFALAPSAPLTQIHVNARFAAGAVWTVYNVPRGDGSGSFDVFLARVQCDGSAGEPTLVNAVSRGNDVDPMIAVGDDALLVVWQSDNGTGVDNLDILYRTFDADGAPIMAEDRVLETERAGAPVTGNALFPAAAATPDGGFAIAGVRGLDEAGTFQAFVQRVAADGELVGAAIDPIVEPGITHSSPAIAADEAGGLLVAWTRSEAADDDVVTGRIAPGASVMEPPPARASGSSPTSSPAFDLAGGYLAFSAVVGGDPQIVLLGGGAAVDLGAAGELDHTPAIAAGPGGGAVFWYRNISGIRNDAVVQRFDFDGANLTLGTERVLVTNPAAAPYGPTITHVQDDVYFVAWSEGTSPDLVLAGQFVDLAN